MDTKGSSTDDSLNQIVPQPNQRPSFENRLKALKTSQSNLKRIKNIKRLKFRDEIDGHIGIADLIDVESYKTFNNIEISQEMQCELCSCLLI